MEQGRPRRNTLIISHSNDSWFAAGSGSQQSTSQPANANQQLILPEQIKVLEEDLEKYLTTVKFDDSTSTFVRGKCSWNDVLNELERVKEESDVKQKKWYRKVRRVAADIGPDITPWIRLIPSDNGLSALSGGLAVFFMASAATQVERNRENILDAFEDIPLIVQHAADKLDAFPSNVRLWDCVRELYGTILQKLPILIRLLLHKKLKNKILAPLTTTTTSDQIDECLERIKKKANEVDILTTNLTQWTTAQTYQQVTSIFQRQEETRSKQEYSIDLLEFSMLKQDRDKQEIIAAIGSEGNDQVSNRLINEIIKEIRETLKKSEEARKRSHLHPLFSLEELYEILCFDHVKAHEGLQYILRQGNNFNTISMGRASYLLQREEFKHWFFSDDTGLIIVNGNLNAARGSRISPLSWVCARFTESLTDMGHALVLHHFCSENMSTKDGEISGPRRAMCNLLGQLLSLINDRYILDLTFIDSRRWQKGLVELDLVYLCRMFWKLLNQLPTISIYCIIEGVSLYEREEWREEILFWMDELQEISQDDNLKPRLKILMTYPSRARYIGPRIEVGQCISLSVNEIDRQLRHPRFHNYT